MAIYHFSAKVISRASGASALASAAYRSASRLHDQRLERHHDFSNKAGVVHSEVMLPDGAPEHLSDRESLWKAVEAGEKRIDAQLAREIEFAIPRELDQEQGIALARDFIRDEFVARGMIADLNVHWDIGADGLAKPHAHVMLTMRSVGQEGFGQKVRDWNRTGLIEHWREAWAQHANRRMAELDIDARIDHRSFATQGIELEPQNKIGPAALRTAGEGLESERFDEHRDIARGNGDQIIAEPGIALDAITRTQATFTHRDLAMFVHRHSEGKEQFDQVIGAVRGSPELVALGEDGKGEARFTSRAMIESEQRLERAAAMMAERERHRVGEGDRERAVDASTRRGLILSTEQRAAFEHVTEARDLGIVVGYAGTGKSAMLGVAREAWEAAGYTVRGAALSGIAAENLEQGSGITSRTIASLEHAWARDREQLGPRDVLVIDEAGMIGSRQMERVLSYAEQAGAKVVLVGDAQQLQAIEAGAAFRLLAERHGAAEISEVRRQRDDWQRDTTRQLATGRTGEAIRAYESAGMVHAAETREQARSALIERWHAERKSDPSRSQIILSHTRDEVRELNGMARDALTRDGTLASEITLKTSLGKALFAAGDRIIFLRNERDLGVKNGTLASVEQVSPTRMAVRLDDGRAVAFDLKHYADIDHGYATTIHKSQGVTVDRTYLLATPGLDSHSSYVALSRHRDSVQLHHGRDDFASTEQLVRTLSRERAKDSTLDYDVAREQFAERRGIAARLLDTVLGRERSDAPVVGAVPPARGMFAGLRLEEEREAASPSRGMFDGLRLGPQEPGAPSAQRSRMFDGLRLNSGDDMHPGRQAETGLANAVARYARAHQDIDRMIADKLPTLEHQKTALVRAGKALDKAQPHAARDLGEAFDRDPTLAGEAAKGRTANAIRAMQLEAEVRTNPELRADRFVQAWRALVARRGQVESWSDQGTRIETRMKGMASGLSQDPALDRALARRVNDLGLGKQWSLQWTPGRADGGVGRTKPPERSGPSVGSQLLETISRSRDRGISL